MVGSWLAEVRPVPKTGSHLSDDALAREAVEDEVSGNACQKRSDRNPNIGL